MPSLYAEINPGSVSQCKKEEIFYKEEFSVRGKDVRGGERKSGDAVHGMVWRRRT